MIPLFKKQNPIQENERAGYSAALSNTQGNILKSHGRDYTFNAFLTFTGDPAEIQAVIRKLAAEVTSAAAQDQHIRDFKREKKEVLFLTFGLSADGYRYLGYNEQQSFTAGFWSGMKNAQSRLGDAPSSAWEAAYQSPLHAMILVAHDHPETLKAELKRVSGLFDGLAAIVTEAAAVVHNAQQQVVEHFGFVDGISQPIFFQADLKPPIDAWDPSAGPSLVLQKDPYAASDDECGSYLVFRKLEQDIPGFQAKIASLEGLLAAGQDPGLSGAFVMGRFANGTPVALNNTPQNQTPANNFVYTGATPASGSDPFDKRCPVSAHIRKMNPRGDTPTGIEAEKSRRIARRGITYGVAGRDAGVGLLFQCCQSSLEDQFEFLQGQWANQTRKPAADSGTDPVIAERPAAGQTFPMEWNLSSKVGLNIGGFVTLRGGEYFYMPSIGFLRRI